MASKRQSSLLSFVNKPSKKVKTIQEGSSSDCSVSHVSKLMHISSLLIIIHYNSNYCLLGESDDPVAIEVSSVTSAVAIATDTSSAGDTISIIESSVEEPEEDWSNEPPEFTDSMTTSIITSLSPIATSLPASSTAVTQNSQNSSLSSQLPSDIAMDKVHKPVGQGS